MRFRLVILGVVISCLAQIAIAEEKPSTAQRHIFYGEVTAVDLTAKTLTIRSGGKSFVFHYTDETKISSFREYIRWDKVRRGQGATVEMRVGSHGEGIALKVRFDDAAVPDTVLSQYSVRTIKAETISGIAVSNYVAEEPKSERFVRAASIGTPTVGIFVLSVQPDGMVSSVRPLQSMASNEANERAAAWLRRWRFQPNSVTEARIPVAITRGY